MKLYKNPFKTIKMLCRWIARKLVIAYANLLYNQARKKADEMYRHNPQMYYVASEVFNPNKLTIYDRWKFKAQRRAFGEAGKKTNLVLMKYGCYYHTPDKVGNQAMTEKEIKRAKKYFILERLAKAKLL